MWWIIILIQLLLNYSDIFCENQTTILSNNSIDFQKLYEKLEKNCQNQNELNAFKRLSQIITDIKLFESELTTDRNSTQFKKGSVDGRVSHFITKTIVNIAKVVDIRDFFNSLKEGISTALTCLACHSFVQIVFNRMFSADTIAFAFINICIILKLSEYEVCEGYITIFKDQIEYIRQNTKVTQLEMCAIVMGDQCYSGGDSPNIYWKIEIPKNTNNIEFKYNKEKDPKKKFNILHITDIHLDMEYVSTPLLQCNTPYCCRKNFINGEKNKSVNYWGSYPCDTPLQTLDNWVRNVNWDDIDWTYWTGDVVPHDSWADSKEKSMQASDIIINYLKTYSKNKVVVPAIGNHIIVPVGCYPPPHLSSQFDISWLYQSLAQQWSKWLSSDALQSIPNGGFYALKIRPGLKIIVMNTNYCARLNIWILYQSIDPSNQLKWLINELDEAERDNHLVHIVGHIPPDNRECTQSWLYNYMAIIERYSHIIVGQFFGHTHYDEFRVLYSVNNSSKPIGLELIGPSLTTYSKMNPAYRIISTNSRGEIIDIDTYAFDLREANKDDLSYPRWYHQYSMANTYSIDRFDEHEFNSLIKTIESNENYLQTFHLLSLRNSSYAKNGCDNRCKSKFIYDTIIANPFIQKPKPLIESLTTFIRNSLN